MNNLLRNKNGRWPNGCRIGVLASVAVMLMPMLVRAELDLSKLPPAATQPIDFARDIKPLFEASCIKCHGAEKAKNGFRLDSRAHALAGGDHGAAIIPGDGAKSPLLHFVAGLVPDMAMPLKGKAEPFTASQIGLLRAWIDQGAKWDREDVAGEVRKPVDKTDWWSLKPLTKPAVPARSESVISGSVNSKKSSNGSRTGSLNTDQLITPSPSMKSFSTSNPIDAFVRAKLNEKGLRPSPQADRRTLIRRLYFDLIGLPPKPEEIAAFVADKDPSAYEKLVDRLLASPHYGERWARHWLDVVHYGETHGYDKDQPRPNAWPYRDYVIRSFNEDKPYARFVQEQVAGDVLFPGTRDGFEALGFISAGPWDLIGHAEVPETKIDGKVARHLDRDDMVANTIQTFNSLTVQCAQCHNHKFDPISQEDYYSLQAVFAAVDRADKKYDVNPAVAQQRRELTDRQAKLAARKKELDAAILARAGQPLADLDEKIAGLAKAARKGDAFGYHSNIEKKQETEKWVQIDLGRSVALGSVVLHPCKDDFAGIGEGFGFPVRFKVEASDDAGFKEGVALVGDYTKEDVANPKLKALSVDAGGRKARFIRVTATKLAPRQNDYIFALAELNAITADGNNVAIGATVSALDSIEAPARWQKVNLTDGWQPGASVVDSGELIALRKERDAMLLRATPDAEKSELAQLERDLATTKAAMEKLPAQSTAFVAAVHTGSGSFVGTGAKGGQPRAIQVLNRGNVSKPGKEVGPGTLNCLPGLPSRFELPAEHAEGERRAALAHWLTRTDNPLTWRSIVNRVWQYHFGRGLVDTPNDFGRMGSLPTHPELLDWLAVTFRDGGQSLKKLHQLIVTSEAYKQSSGVGTEESKGNEGSKGAKGKTPSLSSLASVEIDSDNQFLWRQNRRKLEAEAVRDAVLMVSGKLDTTMGGPSFKDFVMERPEHSPHYQYHLHDPEDPKSHRRSIYRFIVRSQQQPFMTVLDCADPSMQVGKRNESLSPLQALSLLNNSLMLTMSKHFAAKLEAGGGGLADKVRRGHLEALGRVPARGDEKVLIDYAREHGLTNYCRLLLNLNEFSFVD